MNEVSVVVPVFNEGNNIPALAERIKKSLRKISAEYEIVLIDDNSTDNTDEVVKRITPYYPISFHKKRGERGKSFSLLEGFSYAKYKNIAMIDGDLQYPPEAIPEMLDKLSQADIIVAERREQQTSLLRKITSRGFVFLFATLLHNMNYDVQSGLKVFRKRIIENVEVNPSQWTFDLEFLIKARDAGYKISGYPIVFAKRLFGKSHVKLPQAIVEIGLSAIKLKLNKSDIIPLTEDENRLREGFYYKGDIYKPYTNLGLNESAFFRLTTLQYVGLIVLSALIAVSFLINWHQTLVTLIAILTLLYFTDIFFNLYLIFKSFKKDDLIEGIPAVNSVSEERSWPYYTILCPLYREWETLPQFIASISQLDYPKDKLQVLLLLEENDFATIKKAAEYNLPDYFEPIVVPNSIPKTKPKACNYGLGFARGEYLVIYDVEDVPEKTQLKKAVLTFENTPENIACLQAKLSFYNPDQNFLTRLFTVEYALWFDMVLKGLHSINAIIPLGGTSNHFRTRTLATLDGWDSFNVTEDCDLGVRLTKRGFTTAILNSTTYEEANSQFGNWVRQRSRWIKGYLQTYLVHLRDLFIFKNKKNAVNVLAFQIIVGGKALSLFINPFMWIVLISYFAFRPIVGATIESFYPPQVLYMAAFSVVFGNFLYLYYYMVAAAKKKYFILIPFALIVPLYWLMMSIASWIALYELLRKPHYWAKTRHGLHIPFLQQKSYSPQGDRLSPSV